jgi:hypothetical protein
MINKQYVKDNDGTVHNASIDDFQLYKLEREKLLLQKTLEQRVAKLEKQIEELSKKLS